MRILVLKSSILFFVIVFSISACTENENKTAARMDSMVSLPIPLDTVNENFVKNDSIPKDSISTIPEISGTVFYKLPYCGGARPTEEILKELRKEKPLYNSTLKLKNKSEEFFITTDEKGRFSAAIPPGKYNVFLTKQTNKNIYNVSPNACENCLTDPIADVSIKKNEKISIHFTFRCDPEAKMRP